MDVNGRYWIRAISLHCDVLQPVAVTREALGVGRLAQSLVDLYQSRVFVNARVRGQSSWVFCECGHGDCGGMTSVLMIYGE